MRNQTAKRQEEQASVLPVVSPTEKIRRKLEKLQVRATDETNKKSQAAARRHLRVAAVKDPEVAAAMGIEVGAKDMTRVMKFGALCGPVVLGQPAWADAHRVQMRLRHDMYNFLVERSRDLYAKAQAELLRGPNVRAYRELSNRIGTLYARIRETNQAAQKRVKSPEIDEILERIKELKADQEAMRPLLGPELKDFFKGEVFHGIMGKGGDLAKISKESYQTYAAKGLYYTNYNPTVVEFTTAFKATFKKLKTIFGGLQPHYANRDGSPPPVISDWVAWDGAGRTGVVMTNKLSPTKDNPGQLNPNQSVAAVMDGTNRFFKLRPITERDLPSFPLHWVNLQKEKSKRIYIAEICVVGPLTAGGPVFASLPIVLHRPLPENATVTAALIESKKVGLRLEHNLLVTVSFPAKETAVGNVVAELHLGSESEGEMGRVTRTEGDEFRAWLCEGGKPRLSWMGAEGVILPNDLVAESEARSGALDEVVTEHIKRAGELFKRELATAQMPDWFHLEEFDLSKRRQIRRLYRLWRTKRLEKAEAISPERRERVRLVFKHLREQGRKVFKDSKDWDHTINALAYAAEAGLSMPLDQGRVLAIASFTTERFEHLYPWAVNLRSRALRRRKHEYRVLAHHFLKGVSVLRLPAAKEKQERHMSSESRHFAASFLVDALRSVAEREGVAVHRLP